MVVLLKTLCQSRDDWGEYALFESVDLLVFGCASGANLRSTLLKFRVSRSTRFSRGQKRCLNGDMPFTSF